MINLLPDNQKGEIRAARTNILLVRYIVILLAAIVVLGGIIVATYIMLNAEKASAQASLDASNAKTAQYSSIRAEADTLRSSLANAKSILDQRVSYSKLIYEIANSLPDGVIINSLDLDSSTFGTAMTINANANTFEAASQMKDKFTSNSSTFSDVKLLTLESGTSDGSATDYPVKVSISVIVNKAALQ